MNLNDEQLDGIKSKLDITIPNLYEDWKNQQDENKQLISKHSEMMKKLNNQISEQVKKERQREIENNECLKSIVSYNEKLVNYNQELVNLNNKILNKINSLDDTLNFLNSAFADKIDFDKEKTQEQTALLLELITIIESKDTSKLQLFMNKVGFPVGVGLLIQILIGKIKI